MDERDGLFLQRRGHRAELGRCVTRRFESKGDGQSIEVLKKKARNGFFLSSRGVAPRAPKKKHSNRKNRRRRRRLLLFSSPRSEKPHVFCVIMEGHDLLSIKSLTSRRGDEERGGSARSSRDDLKQNKPGIRRETPNAFFREKEKKAKRVSFARTYRYTSASSPPRGAPGAPTARVPRRSSFRHHS